MSNYGALAILALTMKRRRKVPSPDEADLRWLIVLETFPADAKGWRQVGARLLAEEAGLAYSTSRAARDRLVAAGVVEYRPGSGRGNRSSYRFAAQLKVPTMERHLAETGADDMDGPNKGADLGSAPSPNKGAEPGSAPSGAGKGAETPPRKVPRHAEKGAEHNPLTSGNESTALEAFALETSALCPRSLYELLAAEVPDVTERETQLVIQMLDERPAVQSGSAVLPREIKNRNGPALVAEARQRISGGDTRPVDARPAAVPYRDLCPRCSRTGHVADDCPDRDPSPAQPSPSPARLAAAVEPCLAGERCQRPPSPIDPATGYHARCAAVASARASMMRVTVPADGAILAAEQVTEARALREAAESEAVAS